MCKIFIILLVCGVQNRNAGIQSNYGLAIANMTKSSINFVPYFSYLSEKAKDRKYMKMELHLSLPKISSLCRTATGLLGMYRTLWHLWLILQLT